MAIVSLCKSCETLSRAIIDRCKYCGSQRVEVKSVDDSLIGRTGKREFLVNKKKSNDSKAHS
mgnify:CR=1 FL=1